MGIWAPFVTHSMTRGNTLGPYSVAVFLTLGALLSCLVWNIYFMKRPLVGQPVAFGDFFSRTGLGSFSGIVGWMHLGHRDGIQPGGGELYWRCNFLCHRAVRPNGCRALGRSGVERILGAPIETLIFIWAACLSSICSPY